MENSTLHRHSSLAQTHHLNEQMTGLLERMQVHHPALDHLSFALYDDRDHLLRSYADSTSLSLNITHYEAPLSSLPTLRQSLQSRSPVILTHLTTLRRSPHIESLLRDGYRSSATIPTFIHDRFLGFIFLNSYQESAFTPAALDTLKPYLEMMRLSIFSEYQLVDTLINCACKHAAQFPLYQRESRAHKQRVASFTHVIATGLALKYDLDDETIEHLSLFSQYHDIGKVTLPAELLCKPGKLTEVELATLREHVQAGEAIIHEFIEQAGASGHPSAELFLHIIAHHYEFLDGSGYPRHLKGNEIPLAARIVCVANIFDALITHRPYKQASSILYALLELEKMVQMGKLDRDCVNALREHQSELKAISERYPELDPSERATTN